MKNLFSFLILAGAVFVTGFFVKVFGKDADSVTTVSDIFSTPTALADVPGGGAEGGSAGEGSGCEGSSCD